jgi:hypothetical protein
MFSNTPDPLGWLISENGLTTTTVAIRMAKLQELQSGAKCERPLSRSSRMLYSSQLTAHSSQLPAPNSPIEHRVTKHMHAAPRRAKGFLLAVVVPVPAHSQAQWMRCRATTPSRNGACLELGARKMLFQIAL